MKYSLFGAFAGVALLAGCAGHHLTSGVCGCGSGNIRPSPGIVLGSEDDLVANVGDRVFFAFNQSALSNESTDTLGRQSVWLAKNPRVNVLVAGNADERGTEEYNLTLGQRRAQVARDYLVAHGVAESRIQTISYGKEKPVVMGSGETVYQQNRNAITSVQGENPQE